MMKTWREFLYFLFCYSGATGFVFSLNEEPRGLVWPPTLAGPYRPGGLTWNSSLPGH